MGSSSIIGIVVLAILGIALLSYSLKAGKPKPDGRRSKRRGKDGRRIRDKRKLNRQEKKIQKQAFLLIKSGKFREGAKMLESISEFRDAISVLENNGYPIEAGNVLLRMGIPNRAGVVLARNQRWTEAAEAFVSAKMDMEAAKCYYNGKKFADAAKLFAMVNSHESAAESLIKSGDYLGGVKAYFKADKAEKALSVLKKLAKSSPSKNPGFLGVDVEKALLGYFLKNGFDSDATNWFTDENVLHLLIPLLLREGKTDEIGRILSKQNDNFALKVMQNAPQETAIGNNLAIAFQTNQNWQLAGMIFERIGDFEKAGECFEKHGDQTRANYCYQRSGNPGRKATSNHDGKEEATALLNSAPDMTPNSTPSKPPKNFANNKASPGEEGGRFSLNDASITASRLSDSLTESEISFNPTNRFFFELQNKQLKKFKEIYNEFTAIPGENLSHRLTHQIVLVLDGTLNLKAGSNSISVQAGSFIGNIPGCPQTMESEFELTSDQDSKFATISKESLSEILELYPDIAAVIIRNAFAEYINHFSNHSPSLNLAV